MAVLDTVNITLGSLGVLFLVASCNQEDDWDGLTFSALLDHNRCPLCGMHGFRAGDQWAHLLISCEGVGTTQVGCRYAFMQHVCRALGVPLAYFSMSHHVAFLDERAAAACLVAAPSVGPSGPGQQGHELYLHVHRDCVHR